MQENQQKTIDAYNQRFHEYFEGTTSEVSGDVRVWIDTFLTLIPKNSNILEIGSATGRDADYIESLGYNVIRTDISDSFIHYQQSIGKKISKFDVLNNILPVKYNLIFANAVFLHFTAEQFRQALQNIKLGLIDSGVLAFTVKNGDGNEWSTHKLGLPRYFKFWRSNELQHFLEANGFKLKYLELSHDKKWIHVIVHI